MNSRKKIQLTSEFFVGAFAIAISHLFSYFFFTSIVEKIVDYPNESWREYAIIVALSYVVIFFLFSSPMNLTMRSRSKEALSVLRNCLLNYSLLAILLLLTKNQIIESRYLFISGLLSYICLSLAGRYVLKHTLIKRMPTSKYASMVGVITVCERADGFVSALQKDWSKNIKAVALVDTQLENNVYKKTYVSQNANGNTITATDEVISNVRNVPVVANLENLMGWIRTASLDEIFINLPLGYEKEVAEYIEELEDMGIVVHINIPSLESIINHSKFDNIGCEVKSSIPMAIFSPINHNETKLVIKRVFDIVGGLVGFIFSLPIIFITAIPLLLESKGPLIFKQERVGKNGRIFQIYKLRSMYADAEERKKTLEEQNKMKGHMFKIDNDPRITKVGKFIRKTSIDELPQFWNVIKGDMSLVGTRPPTVDEFEKYESHHKRRLSLKPGITGMWQVSGRSDIQDFEQVVSLDCEYIDQWSIWLDIKILLKTIKVVFTHKGAE